MSEAEEAMANEMAERGAREAREQTEEEQERDARLATFIRLEVEKAIKADRRRRRDPTEIVSTNHRRSEKIGALALAMAKAQGKFRVIVKANTATVESKKGERSSYQYAYAELGDFMNVARDALAEFGLAVMQFPAWNEDGTVSVETVLTHGESDQWIANDFFLRPANEAPQSIGSAVTYCRRYAYTAILGLISEKEDDDGNKAQGNRASFGRGRGDDRQQWDDDPYGGEPPPPPGPPQQRQQRHEHPGYDSRQGSQQKTNVQGAAKTPEQAKAQLDAKKQSAPAAKTEARPEPDGKGPQDLALALKSIDADFPSWSSDALDLLVQSYGAHPDTPTTIGRGSYTEAYKELRALWSSAKRAGGAAPGSGG